MTQTILVDKASWGTYTPTATVGLNCSGLSTSLFSYMRVGDVITVSGLISVAKTTSAGAVFTLTLPVTGVAVAQQMCGGVWTDTGTNSAQPAWQVGGSGSSTTVTFRTVATYTGNIDITGSFTYRISTP